MSELLDRIPPHNQEAEQAVLGAMLVDRDVITTVAEILRPESFYFPAHQVIYKVMMALFDKGRPIDLITVSDALKDEGQLDLAGGALYLAELANAVPTTANVAYHAAIVDEKSIQRDLIRAASDIVAMGYEGKEEVSQLLDAAERKIFEVSQRQITGNLLHIKPLLMESFEKIESRMESVEPEQTGTSTGLTDLDTMLGGFQPSDLIILAARPSMGKTALCLNLATHVAVHERLPVVVFSLEMASEQIAQRILCGEAKLNGYKLKTGNLQEHELTRLTSAMGRLSESPIYIDDTSSVTATEIRAKCRRLKAEHKQLGLVVIDYIQLMEGSSNSDNRVLEISKISRSLKGLARELRVPVVALSQLSRKVEERPNKRPQLSDLRESGAIEQDADVVMFIYRDEYYNPDSDKKNIAEIIIAKHRNGPVGRIETYFDASITRFENLSLEPVR